MNITEEQLRYIMPGAGARAARYLKPLNVARDYFDISTPARQAAFLAQIAHESGQLRYKEEIATGRAYEGREDLGNNEEGDGVKFKGHGLMQVTGRANHEACAAALDMDLDDFLELRLVELSRRTEPFTACPHRPRTHSGLTLAEVARRTRASKPIPR